MSKTILIICVISQALGYIAAFCGHEKVADVLILSPFFSFVLYNVAYLFYVFSF